jgi:hypothetical protein
MYIYMQRKGFNLERCHPTDKMVVLGSESAFGGKGGI